MLLSVWLELDLATGYARRIIGLRKTSEGLFAVVEMADGKIWLYGEQNYVLATGEVALETAA